MIKTMTVQHKGKDLHITYVNEDFTYVLATYAEDKKSKLFKCDVSSLDLSEKDMTTLTKINSTR